LYSQSVAHPAPGDSDVVVVLGAAAAVGRGAASVPAGAAAAVVGTAVGGGAGAGVVAAAGHPRPILRQHHLFFPADQLTSQSKNAAWQSYGSEVGEGQPRLWCLQHQAFLSSGHSSFQAR